MVHLRRSASREGHEHSVLPTSPIYICQWTRGAQILELWLGNMTAKGVEICSRAANDTEHVNSVWKTPGKSEFRGRALERVNRIPSFIRPFPEAISRQWKRELRYFLIRCICLNALIQRKILDRSRWIRYSSSLLSDYFWNNRDGLAASRARK